MRRYQVNRKFSKKSYINAGDFFVRIINFFEDILYALELRFGNVRPIIIGIIAGAVIAFTVILVIDFYKVRALAHYTPYQTTKIYDKNNVLVAEFFREKREVVPLKRIPPYVVQAFIAMEDNEFYEHFGINPKGIVRAFFVNLVSGRVKQGGSTITQQLAKILLTSGERSLYRKVKEAFISLMIELFYTKDEIMEMYLNQIFLGHGTYGVESAAKFYFGKHVWDLNLAECSLLATLPSAPNVLSPLKNPRLSMERHRVALAKMVDMGFITVPQAEKAYLDFWPDYLAYINDLPPTMTTWSSRVNKAPWFTEHIRRILVAKFGEKAVYEDGLTVYTTLDVDKQQCAQRLLKDAVEKQTVVSRSLAFDNDEYVSNRFADEVNLLNMLFGLPAIKSSGSAEKRKFNRYMKDGLLWELQALNLIAGLDTVEDALQQYFEGSWDQKEFMNVEGCLISINPTNGYIEAMVGGSDFTSTNQLNRVMQSKRQAGSAIKPLLYTAAIDSKKFTAATTIMDSPILYLDLEGGDWIPENYEGEYYGLVTLRRALALSINVVSVRIADALGIDTVLNYFAKLLKLSRNELKERVPRNFSIALGSFEVSPFELSRAYAIIANNGKNVIPYSIRYVQDKAGNIIYNPEEEIMAELAQQEKDGTIQIIPPEVARIVISLMQSVISSGTGRGAAIGRPVAGKTGTTSNYRDAWFVGFTPQLVTGIWMGYDGKGLSLGPGQSGGAVVAPVWGQYMSCALQKEPVLDFGVYGNITTVKVCAESGLLPSYSCKKVIDELFIPGTEPQEECTKCATGSPLPTTKIPHINVSEKQKEQILKKMKKKDDTILDSIDNMIR
ncbi:MAG TPA: PBP1A family penicillin-binding protein [Spirochaetota bacterium]|nr:PBP1A family penicillin-binding protein [Spirochaetota bacterium]